MIIKIIIIIVNMHVYIYLCVYSSNVYMYLEIKKISLYCFPASIYYDQELHAFFSQMYVLKFIDFSLNA